MSETIIVEIDVDGGTVVRAEGYKGKSCLDATKQFEEALGIAGERKPTAEMHQTEIKTQTKRKL
jgi:hypothetical protein